MRRPRLLDSTDGQEPQIQRVDVIKHQDKVTFIVGFNFPVNREDRELAGAMIEEQPDYLHFLQDEGANFQLSRKKWDGATYVMIYVRKAGQDHPKLI